MTLDEMIDWCAVRAKDAAQSAGRLDPNDAYQATILEQLRDTVDSLTEIRKTLSATGEGVMLGHAADQMRAYGAARADEALERAAKIADDMDYGMGELSAAIRALKEKR